MAGNPGAILRIEDGPEGLVEGDALNRLLMSGSRGGLADHRAVIYTSPEPSLKTDPMIIACMPH